MTVAGEPMHWACPMCSCEVLIEPEAISVFGAEACGRQMEILKDGHIDAHCKMFADELAMRV